MANESNPYGGTNSYSISAPRLAEAPAVMADAANPLIKDTTTAGFAKDVVQESRNQPVLVDFWAPWCGPCKQLTPLLESEVNRAGGSVKLVKMNIDEHPAIAGQLGIQSIPAVIAFKNGQPVDGFMGAIPATEIAAFIKKLGGDDAKEAITEALNAAKEAREAGRSDEAKQIYEAILEQAPETIEAIAAAADLAFEAGDAPAAEAILATAPEKAADAPELAAVRTRIALDSEAQSLGNATEFEARLEADPKDHQARFDLALIQNSHGDRTAAAENLLSIVKVDRTWNDDGARAQLLKLFEAWGPMDEATLSARRKLSSLLFS